MGEEVSRIFIQLRGLSVFDVLKDSGWIKLVEEPNLGFFVCVRDCEDDEAVLGILIPKSFDFGCVWLNTHSIML